MQIFDLIKGEHGGLLAVIAFSGDQSGAESTHDAGDIGTDDLAVGYLFKAAQYGVVIEGTALDHDVFAEG